MAKDSSRDKFILLIEDNPGFRYIFRDVLEGHGCTVSEAKDGETGLEMARAQTFDLILLDLMLPNMNGFQVLTQLKSDPLIRRTPVVILSVLDDERQRQKGAALGADDYIVKGTDSPQEIMKKIFAFENVG